MICTLICIGFQSGRSHYSAWQLVLSAAHSMDDVTQTLEAVEVLDRGRRAAACRESRGHSMRGGLRWRTVLVGAGLCCQAAAAAQWILKSRLRERHASGMGKLSAAQDASYDPTLDPANYESRCGLERHKAPSRTGPFAILGFIHKVAARAGSAPILRFAYAVPYDAPGAQLAVRVFTDRQPIVLHVRVPDPNGTRSLCQLRD